jgi:carbon monoxide dehydrogenase subunit G
MTILHRVSKSPRLVMDHLSDPQKFITVHPVITRMDLRPDGSYLVYETLKVGFIPVSFTYLATIESNDAIHRVTMRARVMKVTTITMTFDCAAGDESTTVTETVSISSILPVKAIINRIFKSQHIALFENIDKVGSRGGD